MEYSFLVELSLILGALCWFMKILPFAFFKGKIKSRFLNSFLYYIPFAIITSMIIPEVIHSTSSMWSALVGVIISIIFALLGQNILVVSFLSIIAIFIFERFLNL